MPFGARSGFLFTLQYGHHHTEPDTRQGRWIIEFVHIVWRKDEVAGEKYLELTIERQGKTHQTTKMNIGNIAVQKRKKQVKGDWPTTVSHN